MNIKTTVVTTLCWLMLGSVSWAQNGGLSSYRRGVQDSPCDQAIPKGHQLNLDFGQFCKYEGANAKLSPPTDHRVLYFGDSITELWGAKIPGLKTDDVINRGISGQTTAQMLVRYRSDVINLQPRIVHLMMGTNDIAGNTGATTVARIEDAISSMAENAQAKGLRVIVASILPAKTITWRPEIDPRASIKVINAWMAGYALKQGFTFADYYSSLVDADGGFKAALTSDGVHPNEDGYKAMSAVAIDALQRANR